MNVDSDEKDKYRKYSFNNEGLFIRERSERMLRMLEGNEKFSVFPSFFAGSIESIHARSYAREHWGGMKKRNDAECGDWSLKSDGN